MITKKEYLRLKTKTEQQIRNRMAFIEETVKEAWPESWWQMLHDHTEYKACTDSLVQLEANNMYPEIIISPDIMLV